MGPMSANAGTSRIRTAEFIVDANSPALSAWATHALHIGQANIRVDTAAIITAVFNDKIAKRLSLISSPEEDQHQQVNPKPVQKMPVEGSRVNRDTAPHGRP